MAILPIHFTLANEWRTKHGYIGKAGVIVIYGLEVQGWVNELRNPEHWLPGCIAIAENGDTWESIGGGGENEEGAFMWVKQKDCVGDSPDPHIDQQSLNKAPQVLSISIGEPYPVALPPTEGAIADFLQPAGNRLLIVMPEITPDEERALRFGQMRCGLLSHQGAILFLWEVSEQGKPVITLDSPFDARVINNIQHYDVMTSETRLMIDVHIVDSASVKVCGLRALTMPPELTLSFLSAVQEQLATLETGELQQQMWMNEEPHMLAKKSNMWVLGT